MVKNSSPAVNLRQDQKNGGVGLGVRVDGGGVSESRLRADGLRGESHSFDEKRDRQACGKSNGRLREHPTSPPAACFPGPGSSTGQREYIPNVRIMASVILAALGPACNPGSGRNTKTPEIRASTSRNPYSTDVGMAGLACIKLVLFMKWGGPPGPRRTPWSGCSEANHINWIY